MRIWKKKSESTPNLSTEVAESPSADPPVVEPRENLQPTILKDVHEGHVAVLGAAYSLLAWAINALPAYIKGVAMEKLNLTEQELLAAASYTKPMRAHEICEKAYKALPSGHTKGVLSKLTKMGFLKRTSKGYIRVR